MKPCADPENDPNDWFIGRDGKQYSDESLVTSEEIDYLKDFHQGAALDEVIADLEAYKIKQNLTRRRHAVDLCYTECYFRTQCLGVALSESAPAEYGTWGGYTEEQLREIRRERGRRRKVKR